MTEEEARRLCMGTFFCRLRERARLKQSLFATELGVSQSAISRLEAGEDGFSEREGHRWIALCGFPAERVAFVLDAAWDEAERLAGFVVPGDGAWWERAFVRAGRDGLRGAFVWSVERVLCAEQAGTA